MKSRTTFFSLESLQAFAQDHKFFNDHYIRPCDEREYQRYSALEVPGFSEVIPFYDVRLMDDQERYAGVYYVEHSYWVLRIIHTGEVFRIWEKSRGKFRLFMHESVMSCRDRDFCFDMQEPNLIGKATEKKLSAWVDYLHMERTALMNYLNGALCRNRTFVAKFREKFPAGTFRTDSEGWTSEFIIEWDRFRVKYSASESGKFSRHFDLRYDCLPTDDEIIGL